MLIDTSTVRNYDSKKVQFTPQYHGDSTITVCNSRYIN